MPRKYDFYACHHHCPPTVLSLTRAVGFTSKSSWVFPTICLSSYTVLQKVEVGCSISGTNPSSISATYADLSCTAYGTDVTAVR